MRIRHVKGSEDYVAQSPLVIQRPEEHKGRFAEEVFGNAAPIRLEVGMGMGTFIRELSRREPDVDFIGFEINTTVLYKSLKRYEKLLCETGHLKEGEQGLFNLRFIRQDARFLADDFSEGEVDRIYLNFSDPWPKDKNANKRLTSPVFLKLYDSILKNDGVIEFKTDNEGLFDYSLETIPACGWRLDAVTRDLHNEASMNQGNVMTEYEEKFSQKGNPIFKLIASRQK